MWRSLPRTFTLVEQPLDLQRGWSQRRQFLRRVLKNPWNLVVPTDNTTLTYNSLQMSTRQEVSWTPPASLPITLGWKKHSRNGNVRSDSDDVSVWEHVGLLLVKVRGRLELSVVIKKHVENFSWTSRTISREPLENISMTYWTISFSPVAQKENPRLERSFMRYSVKSRSVMQRMAWCRVKLS